MKHKCKPFGLMPLVVVLLAMVCAPVGAETSEWVDLGTVNTSSANGLACYSGADGHNSAVSQGGVDCRRNDPGSSYFYFGVDDSWAYQGSRKSLCVAIRYYDNTTDTIMLQYDSVNGGAIKNAIAVSRMNTNTWKTFLWHIEDAYFGNRQSLGADFRIASANTLYIDAAYVSGERSIAIDLGASDAANGLVRNHYPSDGATVADTQGGVDCRRNAAGSNCFYFDVDNGWASAGSRRDVYITVEYYDNGTGDLSLQYDSTQNGSYREAGSINRTNTNTWKTQKWYIKDAYFGNRQNASSDFRIHGSDTYYLNRIYVWEGHKAIIDLGTTSACKGLTTFSSGDGANTAATVGGLDCRQIGPGKYFYMRVENAFACRGNRKDLYITAHYYDTGTDWFQLQYDSTTSAYTGEAIVYRTNTNQWKAYTWHVTDANFDNRQNGSADFRILASGTTLSLDLVYVRDFQPTLRQKAMIPRVADSAGNADPQPFKDLMTSPNLYPTAWNMVGSIGTYSGRLTPANFTDGELHAYMADLQTWQKLFTLEVGALKPWGGTGRNCFNIDRPKYDRLIGLGGTIDEMTMDSTLFAAISEMGLSQDYATTEVATWISLVRERYPNTKIGDVDPYPFFTPSVLTSYIRGLNDRCAAIGVEGPDCFTLDTNWARFSPPISEGSWNAAKGIRDYCKTINLPFSLTYWASPYARSIDDRNWYDGIMQQGADCMAVNMNPDRYNVQSWIPIPALTVPETQEWSFTKSVVDFFDNYCGFKPPNGSFELPDVATWQNTNPTNWLKTGNCMVIQSGNASWGGTASYEGSQYAALQGVASLSQEVGGLVAGSAYSIIWAEANLPGSGDSSYRVFIDSTIIDPLHTVTSTSWVPCESETFVATAPTMTLKFEALGPTGTVFLDAVMVKLKSKLEPTSEPGATTALDWDIYR